MKKIKDYRIQIKSGINSVSTNSYLPNYYSKPSNKKSDEEIKETLNVLNLQGRSLM